SYGAVSIALHWTAAVLFLCQLPLGYLTQATQGRPALQAEIYHWHESLGFLILAVGALWLLWALINRRPEPSASLAPSEPAAARAAHLSLYLLIVLVPLAGWAVISASSMAPVHAFGLVAVPDLPLAVAGGAEAIWSSIHAFFAYAAGFIVAVHVLAAFRHHFHFRDDVLLRMLRPGGIRRRAG
ncbi:MAG TPA: cytochrome b, partial [Pararhizobium sp.]|nr:cytochrome b [Pararhizobium sp.]